MTYTLDSPPPQDGPATRSAGPDAERRLPSCAPRDPLLDNAKFAAVVLVAVGHGIAGLRDNSLGAGTYTFLYLFHMPVFVLVSGYLARSFTLTGGRPGRLVATTLVPYLVFQTLYSLFAWGAGGRDFRFDLLDPYYVTWFLLALFVWRLLTPVIRATRYPVATALVVCLLAYMGSLGTTLDLHRILGLFPFYVLGMALTPEHIATLRRPPARIAGAALLLGGFAGAFVVQGRMDVKWLRWDLSNADLGVGEVSGTAMRIALLGVGIVLGLAFLAVLPNTRTWYTDLGTATLYGYLLHGFATRLITFRDWDEIGFMTSTPGVVIVGVGSAVLVTVLCTAPVRRITGPLVEPRIDRMLARP